ncbi:hypothetical protein [Sphingobacterium hotanense]|uniref:DUF2254 domain-containing protein n=1 Tax=Sphingobacterium hotanense TaxID=649196 RepID=A0ABT7NKE0_9SPHI|nr:hypothetical protein [Sphingobacterium hotanense]MDM1047669.1 hypothetical protein [Sphingobacterium hotanense]
MSPNQTKTTNKSKIQKVLSALYHLPKKSWELVKILYYRFRYFIFNLRVNELISIDFRLLSLLVLFVIIIFFVFYQEPLYIGMPNLETQVYITENTLRTVSIFVGIVFSFIILSFNIFYKYFGRFTFIKFFTNRYIKFIFTLFVSDMILLIYTCSYLKEGASRTSYGDAFFLFSLAISLLLVVSIIPTLVLLLRSSQSRNNIQSLIKQFNMDWSLSYHIHVLWRQGNRNEHYHRDPITLLIEIGTSAIKEFDRTTLLEIKSGCLEHFQKMFADYKQNKELHPIIFYDKIDDLIRNLFSIAIKERNDVAALLMVNLCKEVEEFYVKNFKDFNVHNLDEHLYDGIRFKVVLEQFLSKSLQSNEDTVSQRIIQNLREWWCETIIKVYLPAINYDYPKGERFPNDKTSFFLSTAYYDFAKIFDQIATYKKYFLYQEISNFYTTTNLSIIDSKNTRNTKVYLLQLNCPSALKSFEKFAPKLDVEIAWEFYPFSTATTYEIDRIQSQIPFQIEMKGFDYLYRISKLNAYVINEIKAIAYHAMKNFDKNPAAKNILLSIIEKFDYIRTLIPKNATDQQQEVYLLLERYMGYIQEWMPEYKIEDKEVVKTIRYALKRFVFKKRFNVNLESKGYLIKDVR